MTDDIKPLPFLLNEVDPWQMLSFAIKCVNSLFAYAFDCFNFLSKDNEVLSSEQFQFSSAIHLLYADVLALNAHQDEYTKMKMALSAISKIANIIHWRIGEFTETVWKDLLSTNHFLEVVLAIFEDIENEKVREQWYTIAQKVYKGLTKKLEEAFPESSIDEQVIKLRQMRNCFEHGAFLRDNQFEEIFYQTQGVLPSEIVNLPIVLLVALSSNPAKFFQLALEIRASKPVLKK